MILTYYLECGEKDPIEEKSPVKSIDIDEEQNCNADVKVEAWNFGTDNVTGYWFVISQYNTSELVYFVSYLHLLASS